MCGHEEHLATLVRLCTRVAMPVDKQLGTYHGARKSESLLAAGSQRAGQQIFFKRVSKIPNSQKGDGSP
eukprot:914939-Pelagomonas_calceolata.AAC.3